MEMHLFEDKCDEKQATIITAGIIIVCYTGKILIRIGQYPIQHAHTQ